MNRSKRLCCILPIVLLSVIPLAAFAKPTTIKYVSWYTGESTKSAIALFEKSHPDIKVQFSQLGDYETKILTMASAGVMPDVVEMETWTVFKFGDPGLLEDMNQYIRRDKVDVDDFIPEYMKAFQYNGKLTAIPLYINSGALAYNTALFQQAGVPKPDYNGKDHWDWNEFVLASKKLTKDINGDGKADVFGWGETPSWFYKFWLCQNGGRFFSKDITKVMVDEALATEAFQFEADLKNVHKIASFTDTAAFGNQKVAMYQGHSWMFPAWRKAKNLKWDLAPWMWQKKTYAEMIANGLAITKGSKYKAAAWTFVKWMTSKEGQRAMAAVPGFMPARLSVARSDVFMDITPPIHNEYIIKSALTAKADDFTNILPTRVMEAFWPEFNKVMDGKTTAVEAMKRAKPLMQRALDDFNKRRSSRAKK